MKLFIATISYSSPYVSGSSIKSVAASTKAVAQKRAEKFAAKRFSSFDDVTVIVEEVTSAKARALQQALQVINEQYEQISSVREMLQSCDLHIRCDGSNSI